MVLTHVAGAEKAPLKCGLWWRGCPASS